MKMKMKKKQLLIVDYTARLPDWLPKSEPLGGGPEKEYKPYGKGGIKELNVIARSPPFGQFWFILVCFCKDFGQFWKRV